MNERVVELMNAVLASSILRKEQIGGVAWAGGEEVEALLAFMLESYPDLNGVTDEEFEKIFVNPEQEITKEYLDSLTDAVVPCAVLRGLLLQGVTFPMGECPSWGRFVEICRPPLFTYLVGKS